MLVVATHDGPEYVFARRGGRMALLIPRGANVADALDRFPAQLTPAEILAIYTYATRRAA